MFEILFWILMTLALVSLTALIARKYGVEYMIGVYVSLIVIANILASKVVLLAGRTVPAAVIVYSSSFLLTDMLSEFYGKKYAQKAVWAGFLGNIVLVLSIYVAIIWEPAPFWVNQEAFETILKNTPRIVFASLVAYLVSQNHDVISYSWWKRRYPQHLWLRNNASTIVSQGMDSVIFISLAYYGIFPIKELIIGQYLVKMAIALMDTPFIYIVKRFKFYQGAQDSPE
ncbi:MAG TPA: queuosine precursor transporter [Candidatus Methanofastidiosa archaeon]|nr:queuosine precursor transporter [Candidatus Methanofastidiosa archaeon]HPR42359.1 queuosine precursor transporter [Candidatus Methanofastidiosa archaeon]